MVANFNALAPLLHNMPREPTITGEKIAELLGEVDRPFVDSGDIAAYLDVTAQAVRNKHDQLAQNPELESGDAGQTRVYWLAEQEPPEEVTTSEDSAPSDDGTDLPDQQTDQGRGFLDRVFSMAEGEDLPAIAIMLIALALPLIAIHRATGAAIERLTGRVEAYANQP